MKKFFILPAIIFFFACGNKSEEKKEITSEATAEKKSEQAMTPQEREMQEMKEMAEKQKNQPKENPYKNAKIEVKAIDNSKSKNSDDVKVGGFGYDIYRSEERR